MNLPGNPFFAWWEPTGRAMCVADTAGLDPLQEIPEDRIRRIGPNEVLAIVEAAKQADWLKKLVDHSFDAEVTREHLKVIHELIERIPRG